MSNYANVKPTPYAGILFRSRLEARWASFFDAIGVGWEYEPERFTLERGGTYTPDFRLDLAVPHSPNLWESRERPAAVLVYVEVKPTTDEALKCASKLAMSVEYQGPCAGGLILLGPVPDWRNGTPLHPILRWHKGIILDWGKFRAGAFDVDGFGDVGESCDEELPPELNLYGRLYGMPTDRIVADAYDSARSQRFGLFNAARP